MKKVSKTALLAAVAATGLSAFSAQAQTYNWLGTEGTFNWDFPENWSQPDPPNPSYPNAAGVIANVTSDLVGPQTIVVPGSMPIVGVLNVGDSGAAPDSKFTIGNLGAGTLIFDNGTNDAQINATKDTANLINDDDLIGTNIRLNSNLVVTAGPTASDILLIRGNIADGDNGPRGLTKNGIGWLEIGQSGVGNTYTGPTIINGGRLRLASGGGFTLLPGDVTINNGSVLQDSNANGNCIADTANVNIADGRYNPGFGSDTIGSLEGAGNNSLAGGGDGTITFGGNNLDKTYNGIFFSETSWRKVGTGVQTLGGTVSSEVSDASPATQHFSVLGGRVALGKSSGTTAIGQRNLIIGDGTLAGTARPEVRLLANEQIQVHVSTGPTETTPVTLNSGIFNLNGNNETVGSIAAAGGVSTIDAAGGSLTVAGPLTVSSGTLELKGTLTRAAVVNGAVSTAGAKLDLGDGKIITTTPAGTATGGTYNGVQGMVQTAHNAGAWDGNGLTTSQPDAAGGLTTIGVATGAQLRGLGPTDTDTFGGRTINGASTIAMYTYAGDGNLDGAITGDDYSLIDFNIAVPGASGYYNGDFNYDGAVTGDDYSVIDFNIFAQGAPFPTGGSPEGVTAVPEPASLLGLVGVAAAGLLGRRRRQRM